MRSTQARDHCTNRGYSPLRSKANQADSGSLRAVVAARVRRIAKTQAPPLATLQCTNSTKCVRDGPGWNGSQKYCVSLTTFPSLNSMMLTEYEGVPS